VLSIALHFWNGLGLCILHSHIGSEIDSVYLSVVGNSAFSGFHLQAQFDSINDMAQFYWIFIGNFVALRFHIFVHLAIHIDIRNII